MATLETDEAFGKQFMKRFNPLAGSGATVTVAPEEVETRPVPNHGRHRRWRHPPPVTRHVTVITLAPNPAQNGLQIYFPGKPDETLRIELKGAGWRWSSWNVCWYHRDTPDNLAWATAFIARHGGQSEVEVRPPIEDKIVPLVGRDTPCAPVRPSEVAAPGSGQCQPGGSR